MTNKKRTFGTFQGVFVPSILTILGVILFLRMGWVAGHAGWVGTVLIVSIGSGITFLTALSISSIATNMRIGAGGAYYMISRSFGLETGAAVGLPLFFAQAIGISFYAAGFAESVHTLMPAIPVQTIAFVAIGTIGVITYVSASLAIKSQLLILLLIGASLVSFFMGQAPTEFPTEPVSGALNDVSFWTIFAVFFPAVTGIETGVSMSGDLKNPSRSLPLGTIAAVLAGYIIYLAVPAVLLSQVPQEVLRSQPMIFKDYARIESLVIAGIWGATLSSALGSMLGAPRTLQAMARDRLIPSFLGKGFGPSDEPRIATLLSIIVAAIGISMGDLNMIAPVLSMFFLTSYGFINLATTVEGMIGSPTWRPSFKTPWWLSLAGAIACVCAMLMINAGATFVAGALTAFVYWLTKRRRLTHRWADLRRGMLFLLARYSIYRLDTFSSEAAKTWRPNLLVLSGSPMPRWHLIDLARSLTQGKGFLAISSIVPQAALSAERIRSIGDSLRKFLIRKQVHALVEITPSDDPPKAAGYLVESFGLGPIYPNTILVGAEDQGDRLLDLSGIIRTAHTARRNVIVSRDKQPVDADSKQVRRKGTIRVWWSREFKQNANLMLAIAHLLKGSPQWRSTEIVLSSLVQSDQERDGALGYLEEFLVKARIDARPEIFVLKPEESWYQAITAYSAQSELVLIGIRPPSTTGSVEAFRSYWEHLLQSTGELNRLLYVSAAQDMDFQELFS